MSKLRDALTLVLNEEIDSFIIVLKKTRFIASNTVVLKINFEFFKTHDTLRSNNESCISRDKG